MLVPRKVVLTATAVVLVTIVLGLVVGSRHAERSSVVARPASTTLSTTTSTSSTTTTSTTAAPPPPTSSTTPPTTAPPPPPPLPTVAAQGFPSDAWFIELGRCEQPGNGPDGIQWDSEGPYPGGLGVLAAAWDQYGGRTYAPDGAHATPAEQIDIGRRIYRAVGPSAWSCAAVIGPAY